MIPTNRYATGEMIGTNLVPPKNDNAFGSSILYLSLIHILEDYLASVTEEHFEDDAAENNTADADEVKNENADEGKAQRCV